LSDERFFDEFADDFYAESLEHLATLRRGLLAAEECAQGGRPLAAQSMTDITRSLHTVKGLSGMVGLTGAASVAHAMEECVRANVRDSNQLEARSILALIAGVQSLEAFITAYRAGSPMPDATGVLSDLESSDAVTVENVTLRATLRFTFAPSAEIAARGINVESVRSRLQSIGQITAVSPRVTADGGIAFDFTVELEPDAQPDPAWEADGMSWQSAIEETAPEPSAPSGDASDAPAPRSNLIRVDLSRLDELMLLVGELVMSRSRIDDAVARLRSDRSNAALNVIEEATDHLERQLRDLRTAVMRVRLVQMGEVFERMRFVARDVAAETGKQARIHVEGGRTEIDKAVVERMLEPLLHLVRNAVSHGLETPEERRAAGKDPVGQIVLRADSIGDMIRVQVQDDGRGLDCDAIARLAVSRGIIDANFEVDTENVLDILCAPGFSTRATADMSSGRGVGMEVVRATIQDLGGELSVESAKSRGTCFTVNLPLTLMIVDALLVSVGGQIVAVPQPTLREVLRIDPSEIVQLENNEIIRYREAVLPIVRLSTLFGITAETNGSVMHVLVVGSDTNITGLAVDRLLGLREIVVRSLADPLVSVPGIAGAAELSDGTVTLILDAAGAVRHAHERRAASTRKHLHVVQA
jgi:two-component system, chemotaxis family, sensor kinase CheA